VADVTRIGEGRALQINEAKCEVFRDVIVECELIDLGDAEIVIPESSALKWFFYSHSQMAIKKSSPCGLAKILMMSPQNARQTPTSCSIRSGILSPIS